MQGCPERLRSRTAMFAGRARVSSRSLRERRLDTRPAFVGEKSPLTNRLSERDAIRRRRHSRCIRGNCAARIPADAISCDARFVSRREEKRERARERERVRPRWGEGEDAFAAWRDSRAPAWPGDVISEPGSSSSSTRHSVSPRPFEEIVHVKFLLAISPILCHSESQLSRKFRDTRDRRINIGPDLSGCCLLMMD